MKKIILIFVLLFSKVCSSQVPELVNTTLKSHLQETILSDNEQLFINVDTLEKKVHLFDMDYQIFTDKKKFISCYKSLRTFFSNSKIERFVTSDNCPLYDSPKHWISDISRENKLYQIDWWFESKDPTKLKGITICLIKKGI